eukprot:150816_1
MDLLNMPTEKQWIELESFMCCVRGQFLFSSSHREFILLTDLEGMIKYNRDDNKWKLVNYCYHSSHGVCFNKHQNKLYWYNYNGKMTIRNMTSDTSEIFADCGVNGNAQPCLICADDTVHLIGAQKYDEKTGISAKHFIWNNSTRKLKQIASFGQLSEIVAASPVYIPHKKKIILIGGRDVPYSDKKNSICIKHIYEYSLESNVWTAVENVTFTGYWCSTAITSDQKNIIIVGGFDESRNISDNIYVLQINDDGYKLRKSSISVPIHGECSVAIMGGIMDEMLVIGYVRTLFKTTKFKDIELPPCYIMQMIANWYQMEMLHWCEYTPFDVLERQDESFLNHHFAIPVKHILSSLED